MPEKQPYTLADLRRYLDWLEGDQSEPLDGGLQCVECGDVDTGVERGWTLRLDIDDELQAFCPDCDVREFGDAG